MLSLIITVALLLVAVPLAIRLPRPLLAVYRAARAGRAAWSHVPGMAWAAIRWRWLATNLGLAYVDKHRPRLRAQLLPWTTGAVVDTARPAVGKLRYPRATFTPDPHGWVALARTVPGTDRAAIAKQAEHVANAWACHRVQVTQPRPGRIAIRGLRRDPLAEPYPLALAPPAAYALEPIAPRAWAWHLGRDEWGRERSVPLAHLPAFTVAGLPGFGKTVLVSGLLYQLTPSPLVRFMLAADGKGGGDYLIWDQRAEMITGDDLADTADALADVHRELLRRLANVVPQLGVRNAWAIGPSKEWPLALTLLDEIHTYTDLDAWKGDRQAEALVRSIRRMVSELVRKGRSVMMLTGCLDQHLTTDALPSGIRDAAPLALSFATKTTAKSVAALGEEIRQWPDFDPVQLQADDYRGVLVAAIRTGLDPYCRIRVPNITEPAAAERAAAVAQLGMGTRRPLPKGQVPELEDGQ